MIVWVPVMIQDMSLADEPNIGKGTSLANRM
jgi:hypothetical protein